LYFRISNIKKASLGSFIKSFNNIESIAHAFTSYIFNDIILFDYLNVINSISFDEINRSLKETFDTSTLAFSLIEPI
jgi:predicted Zn-dependent peptidase